MSNVDMCHHDWPGTGCRECMRESHKVKVSQLEDRLLDEMESKMLAEAELHNAAELALKTDARIEELESVLSKLMDKARYILCSSQFDELDEYLESLLENK